MTPVPFPWQHDNLPWHRRRRRAELCRALALALALLLAATLVAHCARPAHRQLHALVIRHGAQTLIICTP